LEDVLFGHWRASHSALRALVPPQLDVETFDGSGWVGIIPLRLSGVRMRWLPPVPRISTFPSLNVRTYVTAGGKAGLFFFSLDAASLWTVVAARRFYKLPYHRARISMAKRDWVEFSSERAGSPGRPRTFRARYRPVGPTFQPRPETLEYFLTERYCVYTTHGSRVFRGQAHHLPWPLQSAEAEIRDNTVPPASVELGEPILHYSASQDVLIWPLRQADSASSASASRR
jgi:uncharacterized protein YqjF (DUF2071 family)